MSLDSKMLAICLAVFLNIVNVRWSSDVPWSFNYVLRVIPNKFSLRDKGSGMSARCASSDTINNYNLFTVTAIAELFSDSNVVLCFYSKHVIFTITKVPMDKLHHCVTFG